MKLVIAEKPSVAEEIAKAIGASKKETGYFSGNGYYVSWCVGHLIESAEPEDYDEGLKKWTLESLPIVPSKWQTRIVESTSSRYKALRALMNKSDVTELICATDAGREGELIFRLVYDKADCRKPFKRLWISSMEEKAILDGFDSLKDGSAYDNLYKAAFARMQADWLVGINATRLYSTLYHQSLNLGRVQTPTINMIVARQNMIDNFIPATYFVLTANCGSFKATSKVNDKRTADTIIERCNNKSAYITSIKTEDKQEAAPTLFDLNTLQRESNRLFGLTAQQTLDIAQSLYDQKLLTYPRTDSKYITADMQQSTSDLITALQPKVKNYNITDIQISKIVNDKKVTDHHALLPTQNGLEKVGSLKEAEKNVLSLVIYRLLAAVYRPFKYTASTVMLDIEGEAFKATGKQIQDLGFKSVLNEMLLSLKAQEESESEDEECTLPADLQEKQIINNVTVKAEEKKTQPPKPYTDATLLSVMENAGRMIEDESLQACGLGTPATRAGIIERIVKSGFIERQKKYLIPTDKAKSLMEIAPEKLKLPELTAEWEMKLEDIASGKFSESQFISEIVDYISEITKSAKMFPPDVEDAKQAFHKEREVIGICPRCGKNIYENKMSFYCEGYQDTPKCSFSIFKNDRFWLGKGQTITKDIAKKLLQGKSILCKNLKKKEGTGTYEANISLDDTGTYVNFKMEFPNKKGSA